MTNDSLLKILRRNGRSSSADLAERTSLSEEAVDEQISAWEADGTVLGYQAVVDQARAGHASVVGIIEVKLTPEREGGFDRLASRIAKFDQVLSCYLMSGAYDLLLVVEGEDLMEVARFVSEKLSTMEGVLSTATHFRLKTYKENGFAFGSDEDPERLPVAP
jgi:DNA-binding Lrp family transcriptional regulator